jgi:glycerol-3-phosphate acyltransferase PlsY
MEWLTIAALWLGAYLLGSINSAILLAKAFGLPDPRLVGSGNPGATNILRSGKKGLALLTLLGDVSKGFIPVFLAAWLFKEQLWLAGITAVFAFLGHLYPIYFQFQGGKGVATGLGVFLGLSPWLGLSTLGVWLSVALVTRYSSLSALSAALFAPLFTYFFIKDLYLVFIVSGLSLLSIFRHRGNIARLIKGEEQKIGAKKS